MVAVRLGSGGSVAVYLRSAVAFLRSGGCSFRLGRLCGGAFTVCCGVSALCWFGRFPGIFDLLCGSLFLKRNP